MKSTKTIFVLLVIFFSIFVLAAFLPWKNGLRIYTVLSGSMQPSVKVGSIVIVQVTQIKDLKLKDIVAFHDPKDVRRIIIHRLIGKTQSPKDDPRSYFITKGDANKTTDPQKIMEGFIIGKVNFSLPYLGYVLNTLRKPIFALFFIIFPSLFICFLEFKNFLKHLKNHKTKPPTATQTLVVLTLFLSLSVFYKKYQFAFASYTAQAASSNTFSSGEWSQPSSTILGLSGTQNNSNFSIDYQTEDPYSEVDEISLYYRYNGGSWTLFETYDLNPNDSDYTDSFLFTSPLGDGDYEFFLSATDIYGNIEHDANRDGTLDSSEYPTSSLVSTLLDFTSPAANLNITGSWTREVSQKINGNAAFELGNLNNWLTAGNVQIMDSDSLTNPSLIITPYEGTNMIKIGNSSDPGNFVWENRLMRSVDSGAKNLSLYYNFFSRDLEPYDNPGFFIRLNGEEIFRLSSNNVNPTSEFDGEARSTGWNQFNYDLSGITDSKINISLYAGNTGDSYNQSWVYLDDFSTYFVTAPSHANYILTASDSGSGVTRIEYKYYPSSDPEPASWDTYTNSFQIVNGGSYILKYRVIDNAGNTTTYSVNTITDTQAPSQITDLRIDSDDMGANSATLTWSPPGNDDTAGKAALYDVRYQKDCNNESLFNFETAIKVESVPAPQAAGIGTTERLTINGLNSDTEYCFGIKTADEAPNWSLLSNVITDLTALGSNINPGDIVINEVMWSGSSIDSQDQWLELKNTTDHALNLTSFTLTKLENGNELTMSIDFTGQSIASQGFFLIARRNDFGGVDSQLNVSPNIWDSDLDLSSSNLQIKLYDSTSALIDTAWDGTTPAEGLLNTSSGQYYSMERISSAGDGTNPLSWYTCIDEASTLDFFDGGADERGTPGAVNRSENEPTAHAKMIKRTLSLPITLVIAPTITIAPSSFLSSPQILLILSDDHQTVSFKVNNLLNYTRLLYELVYETDSGMQGISGSSDLDKTADFGKDNLPLATCSSGGTCIFHQGVKNIKLKLTLLDTDNKTTVFEQSL